MTDLLKVKNEIKKKKPVFRRAEKHRKKQLPSNWRKPKGHHSKIRRKERHEVKMPLIGRSTPVSLKHHDKFGREIVKINNVSDLEKLNKDNIGVVSKKLGLKKKKLIADASKEKKYNFLNFDINAIIEKVTKLLSSKKEKKKRELIKEEPKKEEKPTKTVEKPKKITEKPKKVEKPKKGDNN